MLMNMNGLIARLMYKNKLKKILVVGLGSIGKRHVRIIQRLYPEILISVLRHKHCSEQESKALGINVCFTSDSEALSFQPDAAIISNPATMHLDIALKLANVGVHLLIEKPLADNSRGVDELITLCNKKNLVLTVAYNLRFLPSLIYFREKLRSDLIGELYSVRAEVGQYLPSWRPDVDYRHTVSSKSKLGGGVLLELSHEIDYLMWLFGSVNWVNAHVSKQSNLEVDVEDTAHLQIGFVRDDGQNELIARLDMDFIRHDTVRSCTVIGDKGTLRWDAMLGSVDLYLEDGKQWVELFSDNPERDYTYEAQLKDFISTIGENTGLRKNSQSGLSVLQLIDGARESHHKNKTVWLN